MFKETRTEVLSLVAHFFLCVLIVAGYVFLRLHGIDDEALRLALIAAITYFFGTSGAAISNTISSSVTSLLKQQKQDSPPPPPPAEDAKGKTDNNTHA